MSSDTRYLPNALYRVTDSERPVNRDAENCGPVVEGDALARNQASILIVSDELLLAQVHEGSQDALSFLFRRHARPIRNIAYRILKDQAEAEDLVQEVFLFVFRKAALFDPSRGTARSWLMQVAYHRAFDRRRHLTSRRFYTHRELEEENLLTEELQLRVASYEDVIETAFGQEALRRIEGSLSEVQKRVLHLRFFDGYTVEEIGEFLSQPPGNIRNHYYRALEKIRKELFGTRLKMK